MKEGEGMEEEGSEGRGRDGRGGEGKKVSEDWRTFFQFFSL